MRRRRCMRRRRSNGAARASEPRYSMLRSTSVVITCAAAAAGVGRARMCEHVCGRVRSRQAGCVGVDGDVAGEEAHVAELVQELAVLLVAQRLQRARVHDAGPVAAAADEERHG